MGEVLESLAADNGQWSRQLLENLVDILTAMMNCTMNTLKGAQFYHFRDKYAHVVSLFSTIFYVPINFSSLNNLVNVLIMQ